MQLVSERFRMGPFHFLSRKRGRRDAKDYGPVNTYKSYDITASIQGARTCKQISFSCHQSSTNLSVYSRPHVNVNGAFAKIPLWTAFTKMSVCIHCKRRLRVDGSPKQK